MSLQRLGSDYGGWTVPLALLNEHSIVYSAGVGEDITFDTDLIERVGCQIWAFDPTPRACEFVEQQEKRKLFNFMPLGLTKHNGIHKFYAPTDRDHVSHSIDNLQATFVEDEHNRI